MRVMFIDMVFKTCKFLKYYKIKIVFKVLFIFSN